MNPGFCTITRFGRKTCAARADFAIHHNQTGENNADAHLRRQIMGREVVVAITNGKHSMTSRFHKIFRCAQFESALHIFWGS